MTARRLPLGGATADLDLGVIRAAHGRGIMLRPKTAKLLRALAARPGEVVSKEALLDAVWPGIAVAEGSLVQCASEIRAALGEPDRGALRTVQKQGYLLAAAPPEAAADPSAPDAARETLAPLAPPTAPAPVVPARVRRRRVALALGAAAAGAAATLALALAPRPSSPDRPLG